MILNLLDYQIITKIIETSAFLSPGLYNEHKISTVTKRQKLSARKH